MSRVASRGFVVSLVLTAGCLAGVGPAVAPVCIEGPPQVRLHLPSSRTEVPLVIAGTAWRDDGLAITGITVLGRRAVPTSAGFATFEVALGVDDLDDLAVGEPILLQPVVEDVCTHGATVVACAGEGALRCDVGAALDRADCACLEVVVTGTDPGADDVDLAALVDEVYLLDPGAGTFTRPAGAASLLRDLLADTDLLVQITAFDANDLRASLRLALSDGATQRGGVPTVSLTGDAAADVEDNPSFTVKASSLEVPIGGTQATVSDFRATGRLTQDGGTIGGISLAATLDTRGLDDVQVGDTDPPASLCSLLEGGGSPVCRPCEGEQDGASCLDLAGEGWAAQRVETTVVEVAVSSGDGDGGDSGSGDSGSGDSGSGDSGSGDSGSGDSGSGDSGAGDSGS